MERLLRASSQALALVLAFSVTTAVPSSAAIAPGGKAPGPQPVHALCNADRGARTVSDPLNGVTWLADANLPASQMFGVSGIYRSGAMPYGSAQAWVRALNSYCGGRGWLGHTNWTLPTTPSDDPGCKKDNPAGGGTFGYECRNSAMGSLYYRTFRLTHPDSAIAAGPGRRGPFVNIQPYLYWTSTQAKDARQGYATFSFETGWAGSNTVGHYMYVLPMIPGAQPSRGKGLQPSTDGKTVYDPVNQVTWAADANLAKTERFGITSGINADGSMGHDTAVKWVAAMSTKGWAGKHGWVLPLGAPAGSATICGGFNCLKNQLAALFYSGLGLSAGQPAVAKPASLRGGFQNLQPYLYWSCGAATPQGPCGADPKAGMAWSFSFGNGFEGTDLQTNALFVMVYYPNGRSPLPGPHPVRSGVPCRGVTCKPPFSERPPSH
jgi:hypothetical protein